MTEKTCVHDNDKDACDACFVAFEIPLRNTCPHGRVPSECVPCFEAPVPNREELCPTEEAISFRPPAELQVVCERGVAFLDLPSTLIWFDCAGRHM